MTISYKWLCDYLPADKNILPDPDRLSRILTSIGLEVEKFEKYEEIKGGLQGLVIGEVLSAEKHPNADKLTLTKVNIGNGEPLQIVCGAPNVASGQKVIVARVGTTIYPISGEPITMKVAKIRNVESYGMICAEDEIGMGTSHSGIMVLDPKVKTGMAVADLFKPYEDWTYEIGITPNRMDAMSHWGVARDVCAYLSHHDKKDIRARFPSTNGFKSNKKHKGIKVVIENENGCQRYSGVSISNVTIQPSPIWMQQRLKAIGLRPINNIVDITNFIQHETGQPLHAFDADKIAGNTIIVKNLPNGTKFKTLDDRERVLTSNDLMICDAEKGLCIAGVFGGMNSGVTDQTKNIFLESAWFNPIDIRKTSFHHGLRTDAATRFEKNVDISNTALVLKRAAELIKELGGGEIASDIIDVYPAPRQKTEVSMKFHYLKKLSGKNYHPDTVKNILSSLGFELLKEDIDEIRVAVPTSKPDISLSADLVEEVLRIDGLDNIDIPTAIMMSPSVEQHYFDQALREKISAALVGLGFSEILTNPITNSAYYDDEDLATSVKMLNNLSAELNILRPSMLQTGLESIGYNLNRKNNELRFFEFGKLYRTNGPSDYQEIEKLCLYMTGTSGKTWRRVAESLDLFVLKGVITALMELTGLKVEKYERSNTKELNGLVGTAGDKQVVTLGNVSRKELTLFDIKQPVVYAEIDWEALLKEASGKKLKFNEIPRFPAVYRDLAMVVDRNVAYEAVEKSVNNLHISKLLEVKLFDIFESEKLGRDKKSMALSFIFQDEEKTLTDKEIDDWMQKIRTKLEKEHQAEIRK